MRIVCISDTHNRKPEVPDGDILVHAGDFSMMGRSGELENFDKWLKKLPHRHKIFIAGNHDWMFQREPERARALVSSGTYLEDSEVEVEGLRLYGAPWQPWFFNWAFNLHRGEPIRRKWSLIPTGVDVLITHGPPHGILDMVPSGEQVGCEDLAETIPLVRPKLHVFGHIHESYGKLERDGTIFVNASTCNEMYEPVNPPIVIDL